MPTSSGNVDPFFEVIHDGHWNACIGVQGDEQNYMDGYLQAALELVSAVLDKELFASRDTLVMPILYNGRHALELFLKFFINSLHRMGVIDKQHPPNHDILSHWMHLHGACVGDFTSRDLIGKLKPFVDSLAKIDDDGQELRFAATLEGNRSLDGLAVVNLPHIRASLRVMGEVLDRLRNRVLDLKEERYTTSHTKECSRRDLKTIAMMLGEHASWTEEGFVAKKAAIRATFNLSNRKLSDVIDKIRQSRELSALIGIESNPKYLSDEKAILALGQWLKVNPERSDDDDDDFGSILSDSNWDKMQQQFDATRELTELIINNLSVEEVADIETFFYIGRGSEFGEHYESILARTVEGHRTADSRWEKIYHIMVKTTLLENVIKGSNAAGCSSLASKLAALRESDLKENNE